MITKRGLIDILDLHSEKDQVIFVADGVNYYNIDGAYYDTATGKITIYLKGRKDLQRGPKKGI